MPVTFTVREVCEATGGLLACGSEDAVFTSVSIDSRAIAPGGLFVPLPGSRTDGHAFLAEVIHHGASGFFFSPRAISRPPDGAAGIAVADPLTALQDLARWYRGQLHATVIGVAGSNGKTTTKELLAQVCTPQKKTFATQGNLNNHIGVPLMLLRTERDVERLVLELGTSGFGELTTLCHIARPHIGLITSIAEEHTETLNDLAGVIAAETELIAALPHNGAAVVNGDDDALLEAVRRQAPCRIVTFGQRQTNIYRVTEVQVTRAGTSFLLATPVGERRIQVKLLGSHFALAGVAATAAALECGLEFDAACEALRAARGAARRMAVVELTERQLTILDDCYNANPASMRQALLTVQQVRAPGERVLLVLGDMLELGAVSQRRHREIGKMMAALTPAPDLVVVVGPDARTVGAEAEQAGLSVRWFEHSADAATFVQETVADYVGPQLILVKGSRGIRLEEVTRRVTEA